MTKATLDTADIHLILNSLLEVLSKKSFDPRPCPALQPVGQVASEASYLTNQGVFPFNFFFIFLFRTEYFF